MKTIKSTISVITFVLVMLTSLVTNAQRDATLVDAINIAELHNENLSKIDFNNVQTIEQLKTEFIKIVPNGLTQEYRDDIFSYFQNNSLEEREKDILSHLSENGKVVFQDCKTLILNVKDFASVSKALENKKEIIKNFSSKDKSILYTFIETSKKSLSFWLPVEQGGQGKFKVSAKKRIDWGAIGIADGVGAVGVLIRTVYLAAGGPLSWAAIAGAIGWGAAWGSGTTLIRQLF